MQLGVIGLGRMGASLVRRVVKDGHKCVVYDVNPAVVKSLAGRGIRGAASIDELVPRLSRPRAVWAMVPAGVTGKTVDAPASRMEAGDIIIDGGNSYYRDDLARAKALKTRGIHYVDGGNAAKLKRLPSLTRLGDNAYAFTGGFRLWERQERIGRARVRIGWTIADEGNWHAPAAPEAAA